MNDHQQPRPPRNTRSLPPRPARPPGSSPVRPRPVPPPNSTRQRSPLPPVRRADAPVSPPSRKTTNPQGPITVEAPKPKKEPTTIDDLIPVLVRHAVRSDEGITVSRFNERFLPRVQAMVPDALQRMRDEVIREYTVDIAHALYVAIVVGQFAQRPVLAGVRAAELAADLIERVLPSIEDQPDKRVVAIRCGNLLAGLTLFAVRLIETTRLASQPLDGFTNNFERAVVTTYGLKTQAEAAGCAPWASQKGNPLDKRIGQAINHMSNMFGDYIGEFGHLMDERQHDIVMREFDGFMERFASYIEGGADEAENRRRKLARGTGKREKVEPLSISDLRTRPAGVEIALADGRIMFISTEDARRIGKAADGETEDAGKRRKPAEAAQRPESDNGGQHDSE